VFQSAGGADQVHDFNPGEENGLFWTVPLHNGDARADFDNGTASLSLNRFEIDDYGNVGNALSGGSEIATADLTVQLNWSGLGASKPVSNSSLPTPFSAQERQGVNSGATMSWSAVENGAKINGAPNTADAAVLARDRNGVFF
jgi:hypothetical protein